MSAISLAAIFVVVWWTVLFTVLPWGVRTQSEEQDITLGTAHSAPVRPMLVRKAIVTTILAGVIVALLWVAVTVFGFDLEWLVQRFDLRT